MNKQSQNSNIKFCKFQSYFITLLMQGNYLPQCYVDVEMPKYNTALLIKHILTTQSSPEATVLGLSSMQLSAINFKRNVTLDTDDPYLL